jgi:hypothetical protein
MNRPDSTAKNIPKVAEVKLVSCEFKGAHFRKKMRLWNCGVAIAEQHFFKNCGIAIAEVLPSSWGIAIADSKKSCACPPLLESKLCEYMLQCSVGKASVESQLEE